ncbi:hypothetical protein MUS1_11785 [Marinomonas ushuaiensis DSM 15871]|uniref:Uncharacterized protein n=1 Tax=Marinomonas ushuaiensis DSM 15871 TaxID=1122207 RepID=X7E7J6_9GAMM|nr:hypothetical protein MUS1_11785 [Marinomonas ushuaiensis DSM 15871]
MQRFVSFFLELLLLLFIINKRFVMKRVNFFARAVFLVVLAFSVTACVFLPDGPHGHAGAAAGHK